MAVIISAVEPGSEAHKHGVKPGDKLVSISGHPIRDVLDYQFYLTERRVTLKLETKSGPRELTIKKGEYDDIGLSFETYLMDKQQRCKNNCIFCFIDQNPPGMRESIYFKDDDERLSFLFGNYITLTNLTEREVERIITMKISPVNISVHTMNPELRVRMMRNKNAGEALRFIDRFHEAGIKMNIQLVLVPGYNDGEELKYSLKRLCEYRPSVVSVACVPVGLSAHREGLSELHPFSRGEAAAVIDIINARADIAGERFCYPSDEFFLLAGQEMPDGEYYGDFAQLENGVGMWALFREEFMSAFKLAEGEARAQSLSLVTGEAAYPLIAGLSGEVAAAHPNVKIKVHKVKNRFFGGHITVSGLLTGSDILAALEGQELGDKVIYPENMLRDGGDLFLDGMTPGELSERLHTEFMPCPQDGGAFADILLGQD